MKAMILAAGLGKRFAPITDTLPKPLIKVKGRCLIDYHIERIAQAGIGQVIINIYHLGDMIRNHVSSSDNYGMQIIYSDERPELLNTGGGIVNALPLLGDDNFVVINADVFTDYAIQNVTLERQAHLILVDNPNHGHGDFYLQDRQVRLSGDRMLTFSGISYYTPSFFEDLKEKRFSLVDALRTKINESAVSGEYYAGLWTDVGTQERLIELEKHLSNRQ